MRCTGWLRLIGLLLIIGGNFGIFYAAGNLFIVREVIFLPVCLEMNEVLCSIVV